MRPRTTTRLLALLAVGAVALAACGGDQQDPATDAAASDEQPTGAPDDTDEDTDDADAEADATARTVEHALGTSTVPDASEIGSVVVIEGRRDLEVALALGLPVTGAPSAGDDAPFPEHLAELTADVEPLFPRNEPDLEAIAALGPDLIISRESNATDIYDQLSTIAPVLPVAAGGPWRDDLLFVAEAVGLGDRAQELVAAHEQRRAEVAEAHAEALDRPLAIVQYNVGGELFWSNPDGFLLQAQVLDELGGTFVDAQLAASEYEEWSQERVSEFLGDAAGIMLVTGLDPTAELEDLADLEVWQQLPAVQDGAVVTVPFQLNYGSVLAADAALDALDELLATVAG